MKEDFLHYIWKFQKLTGSHFYCVHGENLQIRHPGIHNFQSGPDFFNAQLIIDNQFWAGNVEIHLKSSDWYVHRHEEDSAYENVILHVVWEHDMEIYRADNSPIATLVLKPYTSSLILNNYNKLFSKHRKWINCEDDFPTVDEFVISNWLERLFIERLERKEFQIKKELQALKNHWEALLFRMLCKNFGLKINGESFLSLAHSIDFSIIQKATDIEQLEALFFGQVGLLNPEKQEAYYQNLRKEYAFLKHKYHLQNTSVIPPQFFRLRPPNFPTIRLAQLAALYIKFKNLFYQVIEAGSLEEFYQIFDLSASEYWDNHYNFEVSGAKRKKKLTKDFIHLLLINTIIPLKFIYARETGKDISEELLTLTSSIPSEENSIIKKFNSIRKVSENAIHSQALIQLKTAYCDQNKCLDCAIGNHIIGR